MPYSSKSLHKILASIAPIALILLAGCGDSYDSTVNGIVTLNSAPLSRGVVTFSPRSAGTMAYGQIGADGAYRLSTGSAEGLMPGDYDVSVVATENTGDRGKDGGPPPMGKLITPEWYRHPSESGLSYTVESGDNEINIELTTTPPPGWKPPPGRRR